MQRCCPLGRPPPHAYLKSTNLYPAGMEASLLGSHPRLAPHLDARADRRRARLLEGMTRAVFEKGYAAATVTDAVRHARVSRGTFYELFASKEACFLEAYAHGVDVLVDRVAQAVEAAPDWRAGLEAGLAAYLDTLATEPLFARSYMLEVNAAGPRAQAERDAALRRFAKRYGASFAAAAREDPTLRVPVPRGAVRARRRRRPARQRPRAPARAGRPARPPARPHSRRHVRPVRLVRQGVTRWI